MNKKQSFSNLSTALSSGLIIENEEYLYFGGTAYLGIPQNKDFIKLYVDGIDRYGLNNGTSRGNNVQLGIYNEAEAFAANRFDAEDALITSSGYLAAKLTIQSYAQQGEFRYGPNSHPALWIGDDPKNNLSFKDWTEKIVAEINDSEAQKWVLLSNSMNNLYPEIYDFSFIKDINSNKNVVLIIDDSHGIGMLNNGIGVLKNVSIVSNVEVVVVASMAKALGLDAGVVLGSAKAISQLKQSNEFYGASPPSAAGLYAFINAGNIYTEAYQNLQKNVKMFKQKPANKNDWHFVEDFPVFLSKQSDIEQRLLAQKILISSFPYPDRNGKNLNRIVLSSWHSETDILKLIAAL